MPNDTSPRWSTRLVAELTGSDARAAALAGTLTRAQVNWPPRPGAWSVGQCLQHLAICNEVYIEAIEAALTGNLTVTGPVDDITIGAPSRWFIRSFIAASPEMKRAKAPKTITPAATITEDILVRFLRSNERVRAVIRRAVDYDVNRVRFRNPFVPLIRFTVGTGFEILARHEDRHLLQAERVKQTPQFPES